MKVFAGEKSREFAKSVCRHLGVDLGLSEKQSFSDGEFIPAIKETVRGQTVYLIQSTFPPTDNLFELLMMADACKRAGAAKIVAVIPYFGYARQDKKDAPRVPITASLIAGLIEQAGINHVVTMDLHADQIQGFFRIPVSHIYASTVLLPYLRKIPCEKDIAFASPDMGGTKRTRIYANHLKKDMVICYKYRKKANEISEMKLVGGVIGKDVVIVDDLIDTAGTICKAADMMMAEGANSVRAVVTHPILSGDAYGQIGRSALESLIVTNSIPLCDRMKLPLDDLCDDSYIGRSKIEVVEVCSIFADIIRNIENNQSISVNFL